MIFWEANLEKFYPAYGPLITATIKKALRRKMLTTITEEKFQQIIACSLPSLITEEVFCYCYIVELLELGEYNIDS